MIEIDKTSKYPLFLQIKESLLSKIERGDFLPNAPLPSEISLSRELGVSRFTIQHAYRELQNEGVVVRRQGKGTFVSDEIQPKTSPRTHVYRETQIIAVMVNDSGRGITPIFIKAIEQEAAKHDYCMILHNTNGFSAKVYDCIERIEKHCLAGVIFQPIHNTPDFSYDNAQIIQSIQQKAVPCVVIDMHIPGVKCDCVVSKNFEGGYKVTRHLVNRGHKRIGVVFNAVTSSVNERIDGYRHALREENIPIEDNFIGRVMENLGETIEHTVREIMSHAVTPTAFFCTTDLVAKETYFALRKMGISVPEQVSLVGFDDLEFAESFAVPLTTVRQNVKLMGLKAVELLIERINSPQQGPVTRTIEVELIERSSVVTVGV